MRPVLEIYAFAESLFDQDFPCVQFQRATRPRLSPLQHGLRAGNETVQGRESSRDRRKLDCFLHAAKDFKLAIAPSQKSLVGRCAVLGPKLHRFAHNVRAAWKLSQAEALADAARRVGGTPVALPASDPDSLAKWATAAGATQIARPYVTRGPLRDWLDQAAPSLAKTGITLCEWRRDWDSAIWPHATAGFFKVKQAIPRILEQVLA